MPLARLDSRPPGAEVCLCSDRCGLYLTKEPFEVIRTSARWLACPADAARIEVALDACAALDRYPVELYGPGCVSVR